MKKLVQVGILFSFVIAAGILVAQDVPEKYEGREHVKLDREAMKGMTKEERRAHMQAYKQAREEEARRAGVVPSKTRQVVPLEKPRKVEQKPRPKVGGGTITYDTGTVFGTAGIASQMVGNRFDLALNTAGTMCCFPVETSGTISMITFDMVATFFSSAVWSLYSNVAGTTAMQVTSMGTGVMTGLNTLTVANAYMNGPFLAGIFQFMPASTGLAVDTGTTGGQGFHAISINDGTTGSMLTTLTSLNAVFRVTGWVLTPVELMSFEIED